MTEKPAGEPLFQTKLSGKIRCELCPRQCCLKPGQRGFCYVRQNTGESIECVTYGRSTGFCIDPIEKKPLNHFYPGIPVLSFGTAGCCLGCVFCQNWHTNKVKLTDSALSKATPGQIAQAARQTGCSGLAYTYNEPIIWTEYAADTAEIAHEAGLKNIAVTSGYISAQARPYFFRHMDAANVDLKGFTQDFYGKMCFAKLKPVLDTLCYLRHETKVWLEITTLLITGRNDSPAEIKAMSKWLLKELGPDVPLHLTAFHPDFRLRSIEATSAETLLRSRKIAMDTGLHYVYTGNIRHPESQSTYCPECGKLLIERDWHETSIHSLKDGHCPCGTEIAGHFETSGHWGRKRQIVEI